MLLTLVLQDYSSSVQDIKEDLRRALSNSKEGSGQNKKKGTPREVLSSGSVQLPASERRRQRRGSKDLLPEQTVGRTGVTLKTDFFNMFSGDVKPLVALLQGVEAGSVVLMASYDEPATKLSDDARQLISELGSVSGHRVFVGGKGASKDKAVEKHVKNNKATNKYEQWPELVEVRAASQSTWAEHLQEGQRT
ncbi:hypothetical protein F7725_023518, partial [Dissostichus mawsoni]